MDQQRPQLTDESRKKAGISQMKVFYQNQYLFWRVAVVKSIRKILKTSDSFYEDLEDELCFDQSQLSPEERTDIVHNQIKNGWLFEAVAQAEQSIEDLFSLLKNAKDPAFFAKDVITYKVGTISSLIREFETYDLQTVLDAFDLPYFPLDEPWENAEVFERYCKSVLMIQAYVKDLATFHQKYYLDYCQYKHGMAVSLCPFGNNKKGEFQEEKKAHWGDGALMTFDNYEISKRMNKTNNLPQLCLYVTESTQPYLSQLHDENNLLHFSMHAVDIDEVVKITEKAFTLLNVLWANLLNKNEYTEADVFREVAFPVEDYRRYYTIVFPMEKDDDAMENNHNIK